jgi:hypothetical protein
VFRPVSSLARVHTSAPAEEKPPPSDGQTPPAQGSGGNGLVRVTVNLTKRSHGDLGRLAEHTGLGKTDVFNRAVQIYALVEDLLTDGEGRLIAVGPDGTQQQIFIL